MAVSESSASSANERLILVVDDDPHTRNLLGDLCEALNFKVALAEDGSEAMAKLADFKPDLVLLDLMMPRKDGFAVLREMRQHPTWKELPVILLTALGDMDGKIRGMELGADDYVTKPFKLIELQTRVNSALAVRDYRQKLSAAEGELAQLRALDPVTGVGTYAQLKASLDSEIARSRRYGRPVAALVLGFDDYQRLRSQLGREHCDEFVAQVTSEIRGTLREADRVFRIDEDEFVVLLPETDLPAARVAADRLGRVVHQLTAKGRRGDVSAQVRIGGAVFPNERVQGREDLLREANRIFRSLRESERLVFDL